MDIASRAMQVETPAINSESHRWLQQRLFLLQAVLRDFGGVVKLGVRNSEESTEATKLKKKMEDLL